MLKVLVLLAYVVISDALCAGCKWSRCENKVTGAISDPCGSGWAKTGSTRCCADTFLGCVSVNLECKPSKNCAWYDASCLGKGLVDIVGPHFDSFSATLQKEWGGLSDTVKNGLKDAGAFAKLTVADLEGISASMLAQADSVVGMTVGQLKGVVAKVHEMTPGDLTTFVNKIKPEVLLGAIEDLGKDAWTSVQASPMISKLKDPAALGLVSSWSRETVGQLHALVGGLSVDDIKDLGVDVFKETTGVFGDVVDWTEDQANELVVKMKDEKVFGEIGTWTKETMGQVNHIVGKMASLDLVEAQASVLASVECAGKLARDQLGPLAAKTATMAMADFKAFYNNVAPPELKAAVSAIGDEVEWAGQRAKALYDKLSEEEFFGDVATWTAETVMLMGKIVGPMVLEGSVDHINEETWKEVGAQITAGVALSATFADATYEWKVETLSQVALKAGAAFGGDVEVWTTEIVGKLGPGLLALKELKDIGADFKGDVLVSALSSASSGDFEGCWSNVKGLGGDLAEALKSSDAMGLASTWTAEGLDALGPILPVVATPSDLAAISTAAFTLSIDRVRELADAHQFDSEQLSALAAQCKLSLGDPSAWVAADVDKAGALLSGLAIGDLQALSETAMAQVGQAAATLLEADTLSALGAKLGQLKEEVKLKINGEQMVYLSVEAKKALLGCVDTCPQRFLDVVVKTHAQLTPANLQVLLATVAEAAGTTGAAPTTITNYLSNNMFSVTIRTPCVETGSAGMRDAESIRSKLSPWLSTQLAGDQLMLSAAATAVDPETVQVDPVTVISAASICGARFPALAAAAVATALLVAA